MVASAMAFLGLPRLTLLQLLTTFLLIATMCTAEPRKIYCDNGGETTTELLHNVTYKMLTFVRGDDRVKQGRSCTLLMAASESDVVVLMEMQHTERPEQRVVIGDAIPNLIVAVIRNKAIVDSFRWNNSTIRSFSVKRHDIVSVSLKLDNETAQRTDNGLYLRISVITNATCSDDVRQVYYKGACYWVRPAAVLANQSTPPGSNTSQLDVLHPISYGLDFSSVDELLKLLDKVFSKVGAKEPEVLLWGLEIHKNGRLVRRHISGGRCQWLPVEDKLQVLPKRTNDSLENNADQQLFLTVRKTTPGSGGGGGENTMSLAFVDRQRASQLPPLQTISWASQQQLLPRDGQSCSTSFVDNIDDNNDNNIDGSTTPTAASGSVKFGALRGVLGCVLLAITVTVVTLIVFLIRWRKHQRGNSATGDDGLRTNGTNGENVPLQQK